jgi:hypothetical protein
LSLNLVKGGKEVFAGLLSLSLVRVGWALACAGLHLQPTRSFTKTQQRKGNMKTAATRPEDVVKTSSQDSPHNLRRSSRNAPL